MMTLKKDIFLVYWFKFYIFHKPTNTLLPAIQALVTLLKITHKINSHRFYTKWIQTQWQKQKPQKFVFSQFWRSELQNKTTDVVTKPGGSRGEISNASSQFLFVARNPWYFFTCRNITSISPTWPHHFLLYITVGYFLFLLRTLSLNLGVSFTQYNIILFFVLIICTKAWFQNRVTFWSSILMVILMGHYSTDYTI